MVGKTDLIIAIMDSNPVALSSVESFVKTYFSGKRITTTIKTFSTSFALLSEKTDFDVVFCDVEMPEKNGISVAFEYTKKHPNAEIVFVTNREDKVFDSLKIHPFGFVRKEHFFGDMNNTLDHYVKKRAAERLDSAIVVKNGASVRKLKISEILYVEAQAHTQEIHSVIEDRPIVAYENMTYFADRLLSENFAFCHKSYLVNCLFVREIKQNILILSTGEMLPVSRRRLAEVQNKVLSLYRRN